MRKTTYFRPGWDEHQRPIIPCEKTARSRMTSPWLMGLWCNFRMNNNHILCAENSIKFDPDEPLLKYRVGDKIKLNVEDITRLSTAFLPEIENKGERMESKKNDFKSIDEYIATFPVETQKILEELRAAIKAAAPEAREKISYQMPTFFLNGNLVHFAAWKNHIGFYPTPSGTRAFMKELSIYDGAKGSIKFPLDKPLPLKLIVKIVKFRAAENLKKAGERSGRGK